MNKKIFRFWLTVSIVSVLAVLIIVSVVLSDSDSVTSDQAVVTSKIVLNEKNYNFGTIGLRDGDVSHIYTLKNEGSESVIIEKVYTSCMCTSAYIIAKSNSKAGPFGMQGHRGLSNERVTIAPGEEFQVEAIFDPAAHGPSGVGMAQRSIYLETNSNNSSKIELKFVAQVTN